MATDQQGWAAAYQYFWPCCGGNDTDFFQYIGPGLSGAGLSPAGQAGGGYVGRTFGLLQASNGLPTPDPQWPYRAGRQLRRQPGQQHRRRHQLERRPDLRHPEQGVTWFDIGDPGGLRQPRQLQPRAGLRRPDPSAPEGVGNLGNFIYVGTQTGQIYVTQDGGGNGTSNNWINISAGLDGEAIQSIITDPIRGSHDAYAVTTNGVFYIPDSIPSGGNADLGQHHRQHPQPGVLHLRPDLRPDERRRNAIKLNQALTLSSIVADWRYQIPVRPDRPQPGHITRCCTSARAAREQRLGRVPVARQRHDVDALPQHDLRRRRGGRQSAARQRHRPRRVAGQHQRQHGHAHPGRPVPDFRLYGHAVDADRHPSRASPT